MLQWIYIACHGTVTIIGLFGVWIKLEHRLTKIETNQGWMMYNIKHGCEQENENEGSRKVD